MRVRRRNLHASKSRARKRLLALAVPLAIGAVVVTAPRDKNSSLLLQFTPFIESESEELNPRQSDGELQARAELGEITVSEASLGAPAPPTAIIAASLSPSSEPSIEPALFQAPRGDVEERIAPITFAMAVPAHDTALGAEAGPAIKRTTVAALKGDTLAKILKREGVSDGEVSDLMAKLAKHYKGDKLKVGEEFAMTLGPSFAAPGQPGDRSLMSLALPSSLLKSYVVERKGDDFKVAGINRKLTEGMGLRKGTINGSFYASGERAGVPHRMLKDIVKGFSYDVDFQRDVLAGDRFEVVFDGQFNDEGELAKTGQVRYAMLTVGGKKQEIYYFKPSKGSAGFFDKQGQSVRKAFLRTPVAGARISSKYGMRRHPILGYSKMHTGIDFAARRGTPIYAAADGKIERAGWNGGYGRYIKIKHSKRYHTAYAHLHRFARGIKSGTWVKQGQIIGYVGSTGRSTGPHLHYEVLRNGRHINPLSIKTFATQRLKGQDLKRFKALQAEIAKAQKSGGRLQVASRERS